MVSMSEPSPPSEPRGGSEDVEEGSHPPRKRQRVRLSCLECRRRKLSCDRGFPCERCVKSGTPDRCTYETKSGTVVNAGSGVPHSFVQLDPRKSAGEFSASSLSHDLDSPILRDASRDHERIRKLEQELVQLKSILIRQNNSLDGSTATINTPSTRREEIEESPVASAAAEATSFQLPGHPPPDHLIDDKSELRFFRGREFKTRYFGPHNANMAFLELSGLCPFMKETAEEWLKPVNIHDTKDRAKRKAAVEKQFAERDLHLESLIPPKEEADAIVNVYLNQFEQIHRIVHIPTFRRDYAKFWENSEGRYAAFTALVLGIMAVAGRVHSELPQYIGIESKSPNTSQAWIKAVEEWTARQSQKHRRLIHYQITCLLYLAKRVNTVKKKRFWTGSGALIQDGISIGLHREPSHRSSKITVYHQEMRRRIWATVMEFDMQASFDYGLPTLLSQLHYDVLSPRNLDDKDFDENTTELPHSKPAKEYTFSSYQHLARQSLPLRLELSRILSGPPRQLDYDQIIRYTNDLTQEIDSLPSWDTTISDNDDKRPLLAYALLHIQLRQYIIPLHQPYIKQRKANPRYQYSEIIFYNAARDIILLHDKLYEQDIRCMNFLREDTTTSAVHLVAVTMLQRRGSTNMIMINSQHTAKLMERCIAMKADRLLRCGNNEPWGYSILCASLGLLEAHLGTKTPEQAKASSAERFVNLYYTLLANQEPPAAAQPDQLRGAPTEIPTRPKSVTPFSFQGLTQPQGAVEGTAAPLPWLPGNLDPQSFSPDLNLEALGVDFNEMWGGANWDYNV